MTPPVGFVGLGAMGLPMALALRRAGVDVVAWNRSLRPRAEAEAGGLRVASLAEIGEQAATAITMLPDLPEVRAVLSGGLRGPALRTLVVMGTVSPVGVRQLGESLAPDVAVVDAPVSGGTAGARGATLSIMVGGADDAVAPLLPMLAAMGGTVRRMGPLGAGSLAKACNQLVVGATVTALAEAVVLGRAGGLDVDALLDVLGGGLARSEVLDQKRGQLASGDHGGDGAARYLRKDLGFVGEAARAAEVELPLAEVTTGLYRELVEAGLGDLDNSVVLRWLTERRHGGRTRLQG